MCQKIRVLEIVVSPKTTNVEDPNPTGLTNQRAGVILDLSGTKLVDRPAILEDKLLKSRGIVTAEINAFSSRIIVEFDPSLTNLDKVRALISTNNVKANEPLNRSG